MNLISLVMIVAGFVLLYGAIKNLHPLDVIQRALSGKPISEAKPLSE